MDPVAEVAPAAVAVEAFFRKHLVSSCGLPSYCYCWHFHLRPLLLLLLLLRHCSPPLAPEVAAADAKFYLRSTPAPRKQSGIIRVTFLLQKISRLLAADSDDHPSNRVGCLPYLISGTTNRPTGYGHFFGSHFLNPFTTPGISHKYYWF